MTQVNLKTRGMSLPFGTCWHRIARAEFHRVALAELWNSIDTQNSYVTSTEIDDEGAGKVFITPVKCDWVLPLSLQLGEMLYQLRGALDSCVYDAAILKFGQNPPPDEQKWNFPIYADPTEFADKVSRMKKLPEDIRELIESIQPYKTLSARYGDQSCRIGRTLAVLNDWARIDRHRKLHLVGTAWTKAHLRIILSPPMTLEFCNCTEGTVLEDKNEVAQFRIANFVRGSQAQLQASFAFQVLVNETPRCLLNDIATAMMLSVMAVREIFEEHFGLLGQHYDLSDV